MEIKSRTYKTADYGREEKYDATQLPKQEKKKIEKLPGKQDKLKINQVTKITSGEFNFLH